jgi:hypothetical protein
LSVADINFNWYFCWGHDWRIGWFNGWHIGWFNDWRIGWFNGRHNWNGHNWSRHNWSRHNWNGHNWNGHNWNRYWRGNTGLRIRLNSSTGGRLHRSSGRNSKN